MVNVAIMGHGVVGSGVAEILLNNKATVDKNSKQDIRLKRILDLRDFDVDYKELFTKDFEDIINDDEIDVVVEVMGGINPAYDFVKRCLLAGKSVVTSNKELVAEKGYDLLCAAKEKNVNFLFEASVGGGIPVIRPMAQCLSANNICEIIGILNGTTNYILTKMDIEGSDFDTVLAEAQRLGYAERNPSSDIDGIDAQRKICILASLAFGKHIYPNQINAEGITKITTADFTYAHACDCNIKLVGRAKKTADGKVFATVYPVMLKNSHILAGVNDVFNAIMVRGDYVGDVMFYGRGAGKAPTASAVVADVIDCAKHLQTRKQIFWEDGSADYVVNDFGENVRLYVRAACQDYSAAKDAVLSTLSGTEFIELNNQPYREIAFVTPFGDEAALKEAINSIKAISDVHILHIVE